MQQNKTVKRRFTIFYKYGLYLVFFILVIIFSILNPKFFSLTNGINLLQQTTTTTIAACGLVFVFIIGGIDLSMASVMYFTATLVTMLTNKGLGIIGAFAFSIALGSVIGMINGVLISRLKIAPLITTLAMLYIIRGLGIVIGGTGLIYFTNRVSEAIVFTRLFGAVPVIVLILIITLSAVQLILRNSVFGRQLYAIGNNSHAAAVSGINVNRNVFLAYTISGVMAALAGLLSGAQVGGISSTFALGQEFTIVSATVLGGVSFFGGKGKAFPGAFLGVLIIMCIENGLVMAKTNLYYYSIIRGVIIFIAVMLDSTNNKGDKR